MTETHDRESPDLVTADDIRALDTAWRAFEAALVADLHVMVQSSAPCALVLELAGPNLPDGQAGRYLQLETGRDRLLRATSTGNRQLSPIHRMDDDECAALRRNGWTGNDETDPEWSTERPLTELVELATDAVWLLRHCHHLTHPHLLTQRRVGATPPGPGRLGLVATDDVPVEPRANFRLTQARAGDDGPPLPVVTTSPRDLAALVEAAVADAGEGHVDFILHVAQQPVFVRVREDRSSVRLSARAVRDVSSPSEARTEIRIFNREGWLDWHVARRDIWVSGSIGSAPFEHVLFLAGVEHFLEVLLSHRHALARRTGGRTN